VEPFEGAFVGLPTVCKFDLGTATRSMAYISGFARFLRWNTSDSASGAKFTVDVYAKLPG